MALRPSGSDILASIVESYLESGHEERRGRDGLSADSVIQPIVPATPVDQAVGPHGAAKSSRLHWILHFTLTGRKLDDQDGWSDAFIRVVGTSSGSSLDVLIDGVASLLEVQRASVWQDSVRVQELAFASVTALLSAKVQENRVKDVNKAIVSLLAGIISQLKSSPEPLHTREVLIPLWIGATEAATGFRTPWYAESLGDVTSLIEASLDGAVVKNINAAFSISDSYTEVTMEHDDAPGFSVLENDQQATGLALFVKGLFYLSRRILLSSGQTIRLTKSTRSSDFDIWEAVPRRGNQALRKGDQAGKSHASSGPTLSSQALRPCLEWIEPLKAEIRASINVNGSQTFLVFDQALSAVVHTAVLAAQLAGSVPEEVLVTVADMLADTTLAAPGRTSIFTYHAALESAGVLSVCFPQVTKRMMDLLRDFAVTPSPTFLKVAADRETTALLRQGCARNISLVLKHKSDANFSKALVYSLVHILYSKDAEIGPPLPPSDPRRISYENILALLTDVACRAQTRETVELVISSICRRLDAGSGPPDAFALSKLADVAAAANTTAAARNISLLFTSLRKRHDSTDFRPDIVMCRCMLTIARRCSNKPEIVMTMIEKAVSFCTERIMSQSVQVSRKNAGQNMDLPKNQDFAALLGLLGDTCSVAPVNPLLWSSEQILLFRDFWIAIVMAGLTAQSTWPQPWVGPLVNIAKVSPPLVVQETLTNLETDLSSNSILRRKIPDEVTARMKAALTSALPSLSPSVKTLDQEEITYFAAFTQVEAMRMRSPGAIEVLLRYISSVGTFASLEGLVESVTQQILVLYVRNRAAPGPNTNIEVEKDVECLVIASGSRLQRVRDWAGKALVAIAASFPSIYWSRRLIYCMLDVLLSLSGGVAAGLETKEALEDLMSYLDTPDRRSHREELLTAYRSFAQKWLAEGFKFAPELTSGIVQNYAMKLGLAQDGRGLEGRLADIELTSGLMNSLGLNDATGTSSESLAKVTYRLGEVLADAKSHGHAPSNWRLLSSDLEKSLLDKSDRLRGSTWSMERATCVLIASHKLDLQLLRIVVWTPLQNYTSKSMASALLFWNSLISARPDLEPAMLAEFTKAWEVLRRRKMGPFANTWTKTKPTTGMMTFTQSRPTQRRTLTTESPSVLWLRFLSGRLHAAIWEGSSSQSWYQKLIQLAIDRCLRERTPSVDKRTLSFVLQAATLALEAATRRSRQPWSVTATAIEQYVHDGTLLWLCRMSGGIDYFQPALDQEASDLIAFVQPFLNFQNAEVARGVDEPRSLSAFRRKQGRLAELIFVPWGTSKKSDLLGFISKLAVNEIERLGAWIDPLGQRKALSVSAPAIGPTDPFEMVEVACMIGPKAVLEAVSRFKPVNSEGRVSASLIGSIADFSTEPEILNLIKESTGSRNSKMRLAFRNLAALSPIPPISALVLLIKTYTPWLVQYCARTLAHYSTEALFFYVPQLVQALRRDRLRYVEQFILQTGHASQLFAHQIIWNMNANMFKDDDSTIPDPVLKPACDRIIDNIVHSFSLADKEFYEREFSFFNEVTGISGKLRPYIKKSKLEKKHKIDEELQKIKVRPGVYLPSNPDSIVVDIDYDSGRPLQSHAKAPFLATFYATKRQLSSTSSTALTAKDAGPVTKQSAIFKVGDDCRQDVLALQLIAMFKALYEWHGMDFYLFPYRVVATAPGCGVIDVIPNAISRDQMGREKVNFLYDYFRSKYGNPDSLGFLKARSAFVQSLAPYSVILYILQIKDRHNGNIMFDSQGHILHIDFGFIFDIAPGGIKFESAPFKLTTEMVSIMGGSPAAEPYQWFAELCVRCFLACRKYATELLQMVELMIPSELPCFKGKTIPDMFERFQLQLSERAAAEYMLDCIRQSHQNARTVLYDEFQRLQNQIPYHR